jgi:membrane fusion protein, multidrug efflux system
MDRAEILLAAVLFGAISAAAGAAPQHDRGPSVLVQLTKLATGSLPRIVTVFGRTETDPSARQTVTAPAAAVVGAVYVRAGQEVAAGAPLIRLGPSPATAAAYAQALSAFEVAKDLARRTRALLAQRLATAQELAAAEKSSSDARAGLAALTAEGAGGPQVLRAPFAAIVRAIAANPGAIVAGGAVLVDLARPDALVLRAGAVPQQAAAIRPGDPVAVLPLGAGGGAAAGQAPGTKAQGRVLLRGSIVDPQTGLVPVVVAPPQGMLLPGEMAQARIVTGETRGYVVPHAAILADDSGAPYVVQAKGWIARKVAVRILGHDRDRDVVEGRLDPAAPLVLAGNYQLEDGMRVRVATPDGPAGK